ncbi:cytochrome c [Pontibacter sp. KCTC 32443]|uniref:c-type cytochrome n=1 Tax=Pontibacter TaxID=323449 RepID=UPI00164D51D7|nr:MULTISPECIES: cytochrome c [Pontibacter]MBC5774729.1 cytochrome c [Pontibacter sp. KCTC 32443]
MLDRILGTAIGIKCIYGCLFICFLFFTAFVYTAEVPDTAPLPQQELALQGKHIWQKHNCSACHQFYGLGGYIGPDVTNVMSAKGKGESYVRAVLQNGTATMPDFNLSVKDVDALVAFLIEADKTGKSGREHFLADNFGQIHPKRKKSPRN